MEADDLFVGKSFGEFPTQALNMTLLHYENEIGPTDVAFGDTNASIGLGSGGANGITGKAFVNFFGSKAAPTVAAAHEQNLKCFVQKEDCPSECRLCQWKTKKLK